jgi:hypothetical protein
MLDGMWDRGSGGSVGETAGRESIGHDVLRDDPAAVFAAGTPGAGQYRCVQCAYGITIRAPLPVCPMCASRTWEAVPWTPFSGRSEVRRVRRTH